MTPNPSPLPRPSSPPQGDVELLERLARARADLLRSEEHTSELQSQSNLVCRLLLEKKKEIRPDVAKSDIQIGALMEGEFITAMIVCSPGIGRLAEPAIPHEHHKSVRGIRLVSDVPV